MTRMPQALVEDVFARDRGRVAALFSVMLGMQIEWRGDRMVVMTSETVLCPAVVIDRTELGNCLGRWTIEHVPDTHGEKKGMSIAGVRKGRRAENDLAHCISLCSGHVEQGMKAGRIWNLANRPAIRQYLAESSG